MTPTINLPSETTKKTASRTRITSLAIFVALSLCVTLILTSGALGQSLNRNTASQSARLMVGNATPNPGPTSGPNCVARVILLVDRSFSIIENAPASDPRQNVKKIKAMIHNLMDTLSQRVQSIPGGRAEVIIYAFGTDSVQQNSAGQNLGDLSVLASEKAAVGDSTSGFDGIWFTKDLDKPYRPTFPSTASKGYLGSGILGASDHFGTTNHQQALVKAGNYIASNNPSVGDGDGDVDLVLMITDGNATTNSGNDNVLQSGEAGINWPDSDSDGNNVNFAERAVTRLRKGQGFGAGEGGVSGPVVRPPVAVRAIFTGNGGGGNMDTVFGSDNWVTGSYSNVQTLANSASDVGMCNNTPTTTTPGPTTPPTTTPAKSSVTPTIEMTASASQAALNEGQSGTITITVTNRTSGVGLNNISLTGTDITQGLFTLNAAGTAGSSRTFTVPVNANFGSSSPRDFNYSVHGYAGIDPVTQYCGAFDGQNPTCITPTITRSLSVTINRVPLPS
ncbi:MAG TPA: hypothetical protein PKB15_00910 [Acidimicrobiia bacterium]|nr:hypothetical protein [Acidimicrobiia bacterium]